MKILYAASEARPFIASGGLGDVAGSLPGAVLSLIHIYHRRRGGALQVRPLRLLLRAGDRRRFQTLRPRGLPLAGRALDGAARPGPVSYTHLDF